MKRQWLVVVAVIAAVALAAGLFALRGPKRRAVDPGDAVATRTFVDDSLGVSLRLPESPEWSLRRKEAVSDGPIVTATHQSGLATVRVLVQPVGPEDDLDAVLRRRQAQVAAAFGVKDLTQVVATVLKDNQQEVGGQPFRQWQAITRPIETPGEGPSKIVFMWVLTKQPTRSVECTGMVRFPAVPKPEEREEAESLMRDMTFILQSFQVR